MACLSIKPLNDPQSQEFLKSLGFINAASCSDLSCWRDSSRIASCGEIFIDRNKKIATIGELLTHVYSFGFETGKKVGKDRVRKAAAKAVENFIKEI